MVQTSMESDTLLGVDDDELDLRGTSKAREIDYRKSKIAAMEAALELNNNATSENADASVELSPAPTMDFCTVCQLQPPLRAYHCGFCNRCVATFDHHCFFIGSCVGERNHCRFWWFLALTTVEVYACLGVVHSGFHAATSVQAWIQLNSIALVAALFFYVRPDHVITLHFFFQCDNVISWTVYPTNIWWWVMYRRLRPWRIRCVGFTVRRHTNKNSGFVAYKPAYQMDDCIRVAFIMLTNSTTRELGKGPDKLPYLRGTRECDLPFSNGLVRNVGGFCCFRAGCRGMNRHEWTPTDWKPVGQVVHFAWDNSHIWLMYLFPIGKSTGMQPTFATICGRTNITVAVDDNKMN
ncbi:hypothetical protein, variant 3 [Aphanomyces astaci]|nr:hypothetical protein, variant 3 [Aphanomyces astaci]ETV81890.1 hypothetical protein, variant 3 [Aphanomyces astaci]|eukprot:XP_009828627.1 hypothetical protein, variant 3 [Aphanomyces astaci]